MGDPLSPALPHSTPSSEGLGGLVTLTGHSPDSEPFLEAAKAFPSTLRPPEALTLKSFYAKGTGSGNVSTLHKVPRQSQVDAHTEAHVF